MNEEDFQAIDDELLRSAMLTHRLEYPVVHGAATPGVQALRALLSSPDGRLPGWSEQDETSVEGLHE